MSETIEAAAARWFAALQADDIDWDAFTAWLEEDARHSMAFDRLTIIDQDVIANAAAIHALLPSNDYVVDEPSVRIDRTRRPWFVIGAGIAAAAALLLAIGVPHSPRDRVWQTQSRSQLLALNDGIAVTIAPHSRLTAIGGGTTRFALTGAAYFDVDHRQGRELAITAGPIEVRDIGTRFGLTATGAGIAHVSVAEGQVSVTGESLNIPIRLAAGRDLSLVGNHVEIGHVDAADVASWRRGTLVYTDAPLALVAADIARYSGDDIRVAPAIADRRFSGALTVGDGSKLVEQIATVLDLRIVRDAGAVRLEPAR